MARGGASHLRPFHPPNDPATYRDLLLFEERLKTNATTLQRRKSRYQLFLFCLVLVIAFLLLEVLLQASSLHPYFTSGLLFVAITTLLLFFASGMYSRQIAYANRYVPHANKALRSFNMYLNVRKPPLRTKFTLNPFAFVLARPEAPSTSVGRTRKQSSLSSPTDRGTSVPMSPIPPATNPRGELIFSSRVDRSFRESYERYRAAFERRRQEREKSDAMQTWWGWLCYQIPRRKPPAPVPVPVGAPQARTTAVSVREAPGSAFSTPSLSRRSSPVARASRRGTPT